MFAASPTTSLGWQQTHLCFLLSSPSCGITPIPPPTTTTPKRSPVERSLIDGGRRRSVMLLPCARVEPFKLFNLLDRDRYRTRSFLRFCRHLTCVDFSDVTRTSSSEKKLEVLRASWENEKLALLETIEALKKLYTDTVINNTTLSPSPAQHGLPTPSSGTSNRHPQQEDESGRHLEWRDNLLRAVGDIFDRERQSLVAQLQSSVIDAQEEQDGDVEYPLRVASKLEALERRVRTQDLSHKSELERLISADRDELVQDLKRVKQESQAKINKLQVRIREVQDQHRSKDENHRQVVMKLNNQIECLELRVKQLDTLLLDVRKSLEREGDKSRGLRDEVARERAAKDEMREKLTGEREALVGELSRRCELSVREAELKAEGELEKARERERLLEEEVEKMKDAERRMDHVIGELRDEVRGLKLERDEALGDVTILTKRCDEAERAASRERGESSEARRELEEELGRTRMELDELRRTRDGEVERMKLDRDRECGSWQEERDSFRREKLLLLDKIEKMRADVTTSMSRDALRYEQNIRAEKSLHQSTQHQLQHVTRRMLEAEERVKDLQVEVEGEKEKRRQVERDNNSHLPLLQHHRRQLESVRQQLVNFVNLKLATSSAHASADRKSLMRDMEAIEEELRKVHASLSLPDKEREKELSNANVVRFNDKILRENGKLSQQLSACVDDNQHLRAHIIDIEALNERLRIDAITPQPPPPPLGGDASKHKMAQRIHKLYFRYLRSESYRKALVYQKRYLLLLIGGFHDSEEATLALISRMSAYPTTTATDNSLLHHSTRSLATTRHRDNSQPRSTKFRSAARVVIAVCRMKYLVRKWGEASKTLSSCIESKHGVRVESSASVSSVHELTRGWTPTPRHDDVIATVASSPQRHHRYVTPSHLTRSREDFEAPLSEYIRRLDNIQHKFNQT